jgi:asparagine synthase (glutamine-hydrolysing)
LSDEIDRIDENATAETKKKLSYREYDDGKNVLRKAMQDFIPESIINRKKQGFSAPDESWYRGENAAYVKELLLSEKTASTKYISKAYIHKIVNEHMNDHINHRLLLWSFMSFEWWCRLFLDNQSVEQ